MSEKNVTSVSTAEKQRKPLAHAFKPGQSGNPAGRPKGSRNKVVEKYIEALGEVFEEQGIDAIRRTARDEPAKFMLAIGQLAAKQVEVTEVGRFAEMADDEIAAFIAAATKKLQEQRKLVALN